MKFLYLHRRLYGKKYIIPADSINFIEEVDNTSEINTTIVLRYPVAGQTYIIVDETAEQIYQLLE